MDLGVVEIITYPKVEINLYLSLMKTLSPLIIESFNLALEKLTGYERRAYAAALTLAHFDGSARKAERTLSVSRQMVELGLKERETGIRCQDAYSLRGRKKKKI
jgi:hypothetical protein